MDPEGFPDPATFKPNRKRDSYILFGWGQHECIGKPISNQYVVAVLKAVTGLQKIQLNEGAFRRVNVGLQDYYISPDGSELERHPSCKSSILFDLTLDPRNIRLVPEHYDLILQG